MSQQLLLSIVKTWNITDVPEYRGFRCANCQDYMTDAWHHRLLEGGYKCPVHFCDPCETMYKAKTMHVTKPEVFVERDTFAIHFPKDVQEELHDIHMLWDTDEKPIYQPFMCDSCNSVVPDAKAYHVWFNDSGLLVEEHFCKPCRSGLNLVKK